MLGRLLEQRWTLAQPAETAGVSVRPVSRLARFRAEGEWGLLDRSSAPSVVPARTPGERVALIAAPRRLRVTGVEIAETVAMPLTSAVLARISLGRFSRLEPPEPANRY
jgi:hypothetical protein